ncbi:transglutaminase-like domain-containing protein [Roseateles amylovorans]|uniref:Transglutaminase family protein n=1 Tax=Roseateles amylovorans TaxID=2978473 RepID=A0ABY6AUS2_9BURK|nr:transglutaminase family protein [Roseateles amylovorans]UXH76119.1 transglutaminase family protein [Roseateles amylovorans]
MIRLDLHFELDYHVDSPYGDFVFNIQPACTAAQRVLQEQVDVLPALPWRSDTIAGSGNRLLRLRAPQGPMHLTYTASVCIDHHIDDPAGIEETTIDHVPSDALHYLAPSRYCESDRLVPWANAEFGHLPCGYRRAEAVAHWVRGHIAYASLGSTPRTSAMDTLTDRTGVCRDYAHLMIALCRALSMPARYVTGTDYGANPAKPPDFHAYVEVYLGQRWYLFDPSGTGIPMGFVRIGTGRDAADVPFATLFGQVQAPYAPLVRAVACEGPGLQLPAHVDSALSTDGGPADLPGVPVLSTDRWQPPRETCPANDSGRLAS